MSDTTEMRSHRISSSLAFNSPTMMLVKAIEVGKYQPQPRPTSIILVEDE
ncbi:MAG: hypothetical protein M0R77_00210 [Gammaproteobacteria bacterium]|nr:hypothetical protein [Acholeplasmataceae bacterium]MCK9528977.1 hypothetical protein [Gammaproteobacteria bacterium]